jgi:hypothetical protein
MTTFQLSLLLLNLNSLALVFHPRGFSQPVLRLIFQASVAFFSVQVGQFLRN